MGFPAQRASNADMVLMPWRHLIILRYICTVPICHIKYPITIWKCSVPSNAICRSILIDHNLFTVPRMKQMTVPDNMCHYSPQYSPIWRWRHDMETLSALPALCAKNSMVTDGLPTQRPVMRKFGVFFIDFTSDLIRHDVWSLSSKYHAVWYHIPPYPHFPLKVSTPTYHRSMIPDYHHVSIRKLWKTGVNLYGYILRVRTYSESYWYV